MSHPRPDDYSVRTGGTFFEGALLAANAILDSLLVVRGSACVYDAFRVGLAPHDLGQTVFRDHETRRLLDTMEPYTRSILGVEQQAGDITAWRDLLAGRHLVLLTEQLRVTLMGEDIRLMAQTIRRGTGLPCVTATSNSLIRDDVDAWRSLLDGLAAAALERPPAKIVRGTVGLVGYPFARHEGDALGDVAELTRLVAGLGLRALPVWLSPAGWDELAAVRGAEHLLALPDGLKAARRLAGARHDAALELALPVSLAQTQGWLQALAERTGTGRAAAAFVDRELSRVVPLLDRATQRGLLGRRAVVVAGPAWLPGLTACLRDDLGLDVAVALLRQRRDPGAPDADPQALDRTFDPSEASLNHHLARAVASGGVDVIIGTARDRSVLTREHRAIPFVEFGYPQESAHFLAPTPHVGFLGPVTWAQRLLDTLEPIGHR